MVILGLLAGLFVFFWALGRFSRADPGAVARVLRRLGGLAAVLFGAFLCLRGDLFLGVPTVMFGLGLMGFAQVQVVRVRVPPQSAPPPPPPPPRGGMSRAEALRELELSAGASEDEIKSAHRRLMKQHHPDRGGDAAKAARINAAKELLLG